MSSYDKLIKNFAEMHGKDPKKLLILSFIITIILGAGISLIKIEQGDDMSQLPKDIDEIQVFMRMEDKFERYNSIIIVINSENVFSPDVLREAYILNQELLNIYGIVDSSFDLRLEDIYLPQEELKNKLEVSDSLGYMLIRLSVMKGVDDIRIYDDVKEIISKTKLTVNTGGNIAMNRELTNIILPEMSKISTFGMIGVLLCVIITFRSIRYGIMPLICVGVGIVWMMGISGFAGISLSSELVGVVSMMAGIGIDFAIQTINRYNQERTPIIVEKIVKTLEGVVEPIIVSSIVAGFGFIAMLAGSLSILDTMGKMLFIGVFSCMGVTLIFLPSLLVIQEKVFQDTKNLIKKRMEAYYEKD
ncbi:MAG: MMPL family protein [Candidatus Methanofastidiosum methylothiophilum]|uniref:MMPL family protein n=1 Tax=Candidatus Methanofastidiosum methylothiophilum TaxID=1705564 RepID=A0A150ITY2_9EURY|nr:MAG: MMPL family protein [Candidatus Methanofastidiosum methylthiophilus]KYC48433.1 MAG: MMPL family protein [Candidatus Methanofastidiosum methylthiophilus]KYC51055.1 MAG: MMPL family protein [Candidatus Methanofastidiosum methylthiophilus]